LKPLDFISDFRHTQSGNVNQIPNVNGIISVGYKSIMG